MFDQVFQGLQKATESSLKLQQEMFQKWMEAFPGAASASSAAAPMEQAAQWRRKWEEACTDLVKQQKELIDQNYDQGIQALTQAFAAAESKSPAEMQQKVTELYRQLFDSLKQMSEAQMKQLKDVAEKWTGLLTTS